MNLKVLVEKLVLNSKQENFDSNGQPVKKGEAIAAVIVAFLLVALVVLLIHL